MPRRDRRVVQPPEASTCNEAHTSTEQARADSSIGGLAANTAGATNSPGAPDSTGATNSPGAPDSTGAADSASAADSIGAAGTGRTARAAGSANVTRIGPGSSPSRQLRRVGVKIGKSVLEFQRPVFRFGPIHLYRTTSGRLVFRWRRRRSF